MPFHVNARSGLGAVGIIVETAKQALSKAAEFVEGGHPDVTIKDLPTRLHQRLKANAKLNRRSLNSEVITQLHKGESVDVLERKTVTERDKPIDWLRIVVEAKDAAEG